MADAEATRHPTDSMEAVLALVLKETGKFFRASQSGDSRQISAAKAAISQTIPAANNNFHEALDDIEIEIIKAKSVFERDLSSIRAKRAARERAAAGIPHAKAPNGIMKEDTPNVTPNQNEVVADQTNQDQPEQKAHGANGISTADMSMTDEPILTNGHNSSPKNTEITDTTKTESLSIPSELPEDPEKPKGLAISPAQPPTPPTTVPPNLKTANDADLPSNDRTSQPPSSAGLPDAEFESMFNDTNLPDSTNDLNFDLNFSTEDANGSSDLLDASAFQNIALPNGDAMGDTSNPTANEDLTTLLPGLENYVNGSHDFAITSLPDMNADFLNSNGNGDTNSIPGASSTAGDGTTMQAAAEPTAPIESSFEDMFGLDSYMNGTGDDELGGTGNMGEVGDFDESWFKADGM
ncbi:MAG: hypothetical protein LQ343_004851 [Gyalolechia ehrenbergii]|nr:MAG: hypothetical protein LQ343_004851 [Gyalolechia ehrenbergii]